MFIILDRYVKLYIVDRVKIVHVRAMAISVVVLNPDVSCRSRLHRTTAKSHKRKFVPSSHPGPFVVVAWSRKRQIKVGTLACFDFL